jgi:hypothetical protein
MTVEARELYSSSMGPIVSGSRTPFRANAHRARAERSLWRRISEGQSGGNRTILHLSPVSVRSDALRARARARVMGS